MDSLTQFALGATVGAAILGPRIGPRAAVLTGGVLGTLPDLDVLIPTVDSIDSFVSHRGASHAFLVHALATPLFAELLLRLFKGLREDRTRTYLAVFLIFTTHAIIDALTIYGTRIFWPLDPDPVGVGSIFIIDPIYTLPLLIVMVWALFRGTWSARFATWTSAALVATSVYLAWGLVAQSWVKDKAVALLAEHGVKPERLIASPTPFNSLFWKAIAIDGDRYINLYLPLFGDQDKATAYAHPRGTEHLTCLGDSDALARLADFSQGFFSIEQRDGDYIVSDLRMGMTPNYVFRFAIARKTAEGTEPIEPDRRRSPRQEEGDLDWLLANLSGVPQLRQAEAGAAIDLSGLSTQVAGTSSQDRTCT